MSLPYYGTHLHATGNKKQHSDCVKIVTKRTYTLKLLILVALNLLTPVTKTEEEVSIWKFGKQHGQMEHSNGHES